MLLVYYAIISGIIAVKWMSKFDLTLDERVMVFFAGLILTPLLILAYLIGKTKRFLLRQNKSIVTVLRQK